MTTAADIVRVARTFEGTRFRHQGRKRGVGVDCIGLAGMTAVELGLPGAAEWLAEPRYHNYGLPPDPVLLLEACNRFLDPVPPNSIALADVLVMSFVNDPQHFAIVSNLDPLRIVHAYSMSGTYRVTEQGATVAGARIVRVYRFRGLTG